MDWPLVGRDENFEDAREVIDAGTGLAIIGAAGVGKSRLLHELADGVEARGMAVVRTVASEATRNIPFAPFAELLPEGPTEDLLAMLKGARAALEALGGRGRALLVVDDAHQLDATSLAFLKSAVASGVATLAMTVRTGGQLEADLVDLWTNGVIARMDLAPLDRDQAGLLIESVLGELSPELEEELWDLAMGNPLVLHELIEGGLGGSIERRDDVWVKIGPLTDSARLADLVASRLRALPERLRHAMDMVAVGSPLPVALAREAIGDELANLEQRNLVESTGTPGQRAVIPAHPLYGEILKAHLGEARSAVAHRRLVEADEGAEGVADPLRVALWQQACGEILFPKVAVTGAKQALLRHEPGLAEELLRPLGIEDDEVALLLGRALSYRQRFAEAEAVLAGRHPDDPNLLGEMASIRAQNMGFGLGRVAEARDLLTSVAEKIEDRGLKARLTNERAMVSAIHGDFVDAMSASHTVLSQPDTPAASRASAYVTLTVALAMTGDCDRLDDCIEDALETGEAAAGVLPFARDQIEIMQMSSYLNAGRIGEALAMCDVGTGRGDRGNAMTTTWLSASVLAYELSGNPPRAISAGREALDLFEEADPFGLEPQTRGVLAAALGQAGDSSSRRALDEAQAVGRGARLRVWLARGDTWATVVEGDLESAARIATEGGREAVDDEHYAWASFCFGDAVRLGRPDLVIDDLRSIDSSRGAHLIAAIKDHAEAALAADPALLESVAAGFAAFGAALLGAEAYARAAAFYVPAGEPERAARCVALSLALERRCGGPRTPALDSRPSLVTPREMEVALDAASGLTSPMISEKRYISVRTVDNHLSSVYRKLGVAGREEVAMILEPVAVSE
ncbi:MAG TPA: AAA family ATPase [Acidimicrobiia bacterium]|nr:AAA family ATPase [Acidimicrobiia bacterium]